jgi:hypothetical protein
MTGKGVVGSDTTCKVLGLKVMEITTPQDKIEEIQGRR